MSKTEDSAGESANNQTNDEEGPQPGAYGTGHSDSVASAWNIPDALRELDQWVCWRYEQRDGKQTKVPIDPETGHKAKSDDPGTWTSFQRACEYDRQNADADGIGIMFADNGPLFGVDFDNARDPDTEEWEPWAAEFLEQLDTYSEISPSGTGGHAVGRGSKPGDRCKTGMESTLEAFEDAEIEIYDSGRYFTVTGDHIDGLPETVNDRESALSDVYNEVFGSGDDEVTVDEETAEAIAVDTLSDLKDATTPTGAGGSTDLTDDEVIERASDASNGEAFRALWDGNIQRWVSLSDPNDTSHSGARMSLLCHLAFWTGRDRTQMDRLYRDSDLHRGDHVEKWTRVGDDEIEKARAEVSSVYSGGSSSGNGVTEGDSVDLAEARATLQDELETAARFDGFDRQEKEREAVQSFADQAATTLDRNDEIGITAGVISDLSAYYTKTDAKNELKDGVEEDPSAGTPLDILITNNIKSIVVTRTTDHVQDVNYRFEFEGGTVETQGGKHHRTHYDWSLFRDAYEDATGEFPGRPQGQLRDGEAWREFMEELRREYGEERVHTGPRTKAVEKLRNAIGNMEGCSNLEATRTRNAVFLDGDPDADEEEERPTELLVQNKEAVNICDDQGISLMELANELDALGHTKDDMNGVSRVESVGGRSKRFWVLEPSFAAPKRYEEELETSMFEIDDTPRIPGEGTVDEE